MTETINGQLWQDQPQQALQSFNRDGYVALTGFLAADEVAETREAVARLIRDRVPHLAREQVFYEELGQPDTLKQILGLYNHDSFFKRLMFGSKFEKTGRTAPAGPRRRQKHAVLQQAAKIGKATPPHQDGYYFMLDPCEALTMWLALEEVDEENGCVRYVRGSHLVPLRPHGRTQTLGFSRASPTMAPPWTSPTKSPSPPNPATS